MYYVAVLNNVTGQLVNNTLISFIHSPKPVFSSLVPIARINHFVCKY